MDLGLDQAELDACVSCALCLPHCPTYRVTGDDTYSPRGRIALMRAVQSDGAPLTAEIVDSFETCVQCRGCEPACPSGVPFGHLIESTRERLVQDGHRPPLELRVALHALGHHKLLLAGSSAIGLAQRVKLVPSGLPLPAKVPIRRAKLRATGNDVHLFTGCVMDAWQRDVHAAVKSVLEACGFGVSITGGDAPCCGALHQHAGVGEGARVQARQVIAALSGDKPVLVDSAGCGAAMKDYGRLLGTARAAAFAARVFDIHEFVADHLDGLPAVKPLDLRVAVQDPCHLCHVQKSHMAVRDVLRPFVREVVELDDDGLCCGAGGAYSLVQPELAGLIRDRKTAAIAAVAPDVVVSANPGCSLHLQQAGHHVVHPMELVAQALRG